MEAFIIGWCLSLFWGVVLVPIMLLKTAFRLPIDS